MTETKPIQFDWDDANLEHTAKHGVTPSEIEFVLSNNPMIRPDPYPPEIEQRWRGIGANTQGDMLFIVFMVKGDTDTLTLRPISARQMHKREVKKYERQREK